MKLEVGNHTKYEITDCTGLEYRNNKKREWEGYDLDFFSHYEGKFLYRIHFTVRR